MSGGMNAGRWAVLALVAGVGCAFTATAVYPLFIADRTPRVVMPITTGEVPGRMEKKGERNCVS